MLFGIAKFLSLFIVVYGIMMIIVIIIMLIIILIQPRFAQNVIWRLLEGAFSISTQRLPYAADRISTRLGIETY